MSKRRTTFLAIVLIAGALSCLSATPVPVPPADGEKILHLLNRIGFGPRPGDIDRVRKIGIANYVAQQLHPEKINDNATDAKLASFASLNLDTPDILRRYPAAAEITRQLGLTKNARSVPTPSDPNLQNDPKARQQVNLYYRAHGLEPPQRLLQDLQGQKIVRAVDSERQLQEVMTDFWDNHFNIYWGKGADRWLTTDFEMHAIRPNALGKFKDLLMATAKSPAMLFYLDNYLSSSPNAGRPRPAFPRRFRPMPNPPQQAVNRKRGINENYARELMELHTLGVDGGYTQKDVQEVARAFTGWTIDKPKQDGRFIFREALHDSGEKLVLGHRIDAGGIKDGEEVIDLLARQPSTARFISTQLVRRFVSDDPPQSLVDRVSDVYLKTDGDIREMLRAIFTSPEFDAPATYRTKTRSPFELAVSAIRALGGDTDGSPRLAQEIARMGQPLYQCQPPTGYPDRAAEWTSSGSLVERLNFGVALSAGRIAGTSADLSRFAAEGGDSSAAVNEAILVLLGGDVSEQTRAVVENQVRSDSDPLTKAFALVLGSPEFQKK
jgi:uncharacterized protein (DUF1800 family)